MQTPYSSTKDLPFDQESNASNESNTHLEFKAGSV